MTVRRGEHLAGSSLSIDVNAQSRAIALTVTMSGDDISPVIRHQLFYGVNFSSPRQKHFCYLFTY
jgi:hypothetical protein